MSQKDLEDRDLLAIFQAVRAICGQASGRFIASPREYRHLYGLTQDRLARAAPGALVMHPGPMNRGVEIDSNVADLAGRSLITRQVENGVAIRMACLDVLTRRRRGVEGWA